MSYELKRLFFEVTLDCQINTMSDKGYTFGTTQQYRKLRDFLTSVLQVSLQHTSCQVQIKMYDCVTM